MTTIWRWDLFGDEKAQAEVFGWLEGEYQGKRFMAILFQNGDWNSTNHEMGCWLREHLILWAIGSLYLGKKELLEKAQKKYGGVVVMRPEPNGKAS